MTDFDLKDYLSERKMRVDAALDGYFPSVDGLQKKVVEAARYSLFAGGKRLRPILCLAAAEAVNGDWEAAMPVACALEMVHTYSLIHYDLPAMDDDDYRRGKLTNHKVFGEAMAILAGDALMSEAFTLMAGNGAEGVRAESLLRVVGLVARASGFRGMIGGQVIDLDCEKCDADLATVEYMHIHKTGHLISASLEAGGLLGGGTAEQVKALTSYGHHLGLAFQITDDLLDVEGDPRQMGKQPGSDVARNKKTYPALLGIQQAREAARERVNGALQALGDFPGEAIRPLEEIARYLLIRKG